MPQRPVGEIWARTALLAVAAFAAVYVLGRFEGLPLALLLFLVAIVVSDLFLRRTRPAAGRSSPWAAARRRPGGRTST
ncbi:D-xylose transport system permease protein [Streptomyces sp. yr375]|nr:D-xylose transport system permease protein [Streptomyces sp. yr375]